MMKKLLTIFLLLATVFALTACGTNEGAGQETSPSSEATLAPAVPTPELTAEDWYGWTRGIELYLSLVSDGSYTMTMGEEERFGSWEKTDGVIVLDGEEASTFLIDGDKLNLHSGGLILSREESDRGGWYMPAELRANVTAEDYDGYWTSSYVKSDEAILSAGDVGDRTDVYIQMPLEYDLIREESEELSEREAARNTTARAALGGPLFGDVIVDMAFSDGALHYGDGDISVAMQLQEDGLMRMTLAGGGSNMVLYLLPADAPKS